MNLVAASLRRTFRDGLHPKMPAAGTAQMIASAWKSVTKVKLILVTNAIYSARIDAVLAGAIPEIPVTYNIWDLTRFHRIETSGAREKIVVRFDRDFGGALPALIASGDDTAFPSYLAVIRGRQLAKLYERWGAGYWNPTSAASSGPGADRRRKPRPSFGMRCVGRPWRERSASALSPCCLMVRQESGNRVGPALLHGC
ncbi:hypothetical protein [Pseudotabrizicola alkalilacus]|uniref:hypothetical protein n=1 Tax=Pseudotabrizicola alkalilacus TaxID=2305252 RepID=UPI001314ED70|nr:hypothetical protein [Pseudotabrizicola alkalilacus]